MISAKGALFWLVGVPLPIILLIALFLHPSLTAGASAALVQVAP